MTEHREFYRKKVSSPGFLVQPSGDLLFQIKDLSIDGFQAHFDEPPPLQIDSFVHVRLPSLNIEGNALAVRITPEPDGGYSVGFLFGKLIQPDTAFATPPIKDVPDIDEELEL